MVNVSSSQARDLGNGSSDPLTIKRKITRAKAGRFCTVKIQIEQGRLSVTLDEGRILKRRAAEREAIGYWRSFFEDDPAQMVEMNRKCGKRFTSALSAAKYVIESDGDFHGLDVVHEDGDSVYVLESCGRAGDTAVEWFPEVAPLLSWHLNDMNAGCEHQDALGWGRGHTVALTKHTLTDAQRETIVGDFEAKAKAAREKEFKARWTRMRESEPAAAAWIKKHQGGACSISDLEAFMASKTGGIYRSQTLRAFERWLTEDVERDFPVATFDNAVYVDSISAPCPTCGYRYGSAWLRRELPVEIVELARTAASDPELARGGYEDE